MVQIPNRSALERLKTNYHKLWALVHAMHEASKLELKQLGRS